MTVKEMFTSAHRQLQSLEDELLKNCDLVKDVYFFIHIQSLSNPATWTQYA